MRKSFFGLFFVGAAVLVVGIVGAVLVVPGFIDWNQYKGELTAQARTFLGRDLVINGDIEISLLPAPALVAGDVRLANAEGASAAEMVRLKSLEVRISPAPLLGGNIQVETVKLVEPVIELEVLADGRKNWVFTTAEGESEPAATDGKAPATAGGVPQAASEPPVRLDSFVIENGTVIYRDSTSGTVEQIGGVNARIAAASLSGPFDSSGRLSVRGIPLDYELSVGKVIHGRTVPLGLTVMLAPGDTRIEASGALVNLADVPKFKGKIKVNGKNLAGLAHFGAGNGTLPGFLAQEFRVEGTVVAAAGNTGFKDLSLRLGDAQATGTLSVEVGKTTTVTGEVAVNHINLDEWLSFPASLAVEADAVPAAVGGAGGTSIPLAAEKPPPAAPDKDRRAGFALPTDVNGFLNVFVDAVTFRNLMIRQVRAGAEMAGGEITVSQMSGQFPGSSEVAIYGFVTSAEGRPKFEGEVEASVSDLRRVLAWLGVAAPNVPSDRLRKLTLNSNLSITPREAQIFGLDMKLDSSRLTGGITVALRKRLSFGADLTLDRLNLDAYLRDAGKEEAETETPEPAAAAGKGDGKPPASDSGAPDVLALWSVLNSFDANLVARIKSVTYRATPIKEVAFDGTLFNSTLEITRASVKNAAGASANVNGAITGLDGIPKLKALWFDLGAGNLSRLFRLLGVESPVDTNLLGKVSVKGQIEGSLLKPGIKALLKANDIEIGLDGGVSLLPPRPSVDMKVKVKNGDLARFLRALKFDYRPRGRIGGLDIAARLAGDARALTFKNIKGTVGAIPLKGRAVFGFAGRRPRISAVLDTGEIVVQKYLPTRRTSWLRPSPAPSPAPSHGRPGIIPAAWMAPAGNAGTRPGIVPVAAGGGRWPDDPLDLSALGAFDADLELKAAGIVYDKFRIENADIAATVANGVLSAERLAGRLFGGALSGTARVRGTGTPGIETDLALVDGDLAQALRVLAGKAVASGSLGLNLKLSTEGRSVADMVAALGGNGSLALRRIGVEGKSRGTALAAALDLITGLNKMSKLLGGKTGKGLADIMGTFTVDKGIARSQDLRLVSTLGDGAAKGSVDLVKWLIDIGGEVRLAETLATKVLSQVTGAGTNQTLPFEIRGPLDAPNVKLKTAALRTGGGKPPQPAKPEAPGKPEEPGAPEEPAESTEPPPTVEMILKDKKTRQRLLKDLLKKL